MSVMESQAVDVIDVHVYRAERRLDWHASAMTMTMTMTMTLREVQLLSWRPGLTSVRVGVMTPRKKKNLLH